jgi:hypothetical protein
MGAAGRDFHVFNCLYRDNPDFDVVAFTATQIPHIEDRRYPASLAGAQYPDGILIHPEEELNDLIGKNEVEEVVFAYSDVSLEYVDGHRKNVEAQGVTFSTFDVDATMLPSAKPMIAVCAVRTGCGKSQTSRRVTHILKDLGKKTVAIRHPMPYGDLAKQAVQRFATFEDLDLHECTIEEREEYEPHLRNGVIVYAGVDYAAILAEAEKEADVIIWDGGNNDTPFYKPDLWITVTDPHRAGHELEYFPGTANFERADLILINKVDSSDEDSIKTRTLSSSARVRRWTYRIRMRSRGNGCLRSKTDRPQPMAGCHSAQAYWQRDRAMLVSWSTPGHGRLARSPIHSSTIPIPVRYCRQWVMERCRSAISKRQSMRWIATWCWSPRQSISHDSLRLTSRACESATVLWKRAMNLSMQ